MLATIIKVTFLTLWRDRMAFVLTFLLPPLIYLVFALAFSSAAGGNISVKIGAYAGEGAAPTLLLKRLKEAPEADDLWIATSKEALKRAVSKKDIDVGIAIEPTDDEPISIVIIADATRNGATLSAQAALTRQLRASPNAKTSVFFVNPANEKKPMAAYFTAGVAMLFLLLSGFQTSMTLFDERDAGVMSRLSASPIGFIPIISGKFLFISCQGFVQILLIMCTAALFFKVDIFYAPYSILIASIAASICAAGICLGITSLWQTRSQAHAAGTVIALVFAAIGGSMAPRFLMPPYIQGLGAWTPNALGIDAFSLSLWITSDNTRFAILVGLLSAYALVGLLVALIKFPETLTKS